MKYSLVIISVTLIAAVVLSGCDRPSNKLEKAETSVIEANRDLEIAKSEVEAELRIYRVKSEERINEYNRAISEIKQDINNESNKEVKIKLEKQLDELEDSLEVLENEMENYKASGRENWDEFKDSFSSRMDDLGDSLKNFFSLSSTTSPTN